jgi:alkyl hydroperoxide reductase subunit AhpF
MADRWRKITDKAAGKGGVHCACCDGPVTKSKTVRTIFNRETRREINLAFDDSQEVDG